MGTPAYISPEQAIGEKATPLSDQYSFGILLFELLTGRLPFRGEATPSVLFKHVNDPLPSPREIQPNISKALEDVIRKATAKRPAHRFESVGALNKAFQQALAHTLDPKNNPAPKIKLPDPETNTLLFSNKELRATERQRGWRRRALLALLALLIGGVVCAIWSRGGQELAAGAGTPSATMTETGAGEPGVTGATEDGLPAIAETASPTLGPTASDTPANAATEAAIATTLAAPTATSTATIPGPSATTAAGSTSVPTATRTATPPPSATNAPTATATQIPTATATSAPTATAPPPTATPTTSGGLNCALILFGSFNASGSQVRWTITNTSLQSITISQITLDWPGSNGTLQQATLAGTTIWNVGDGSPPTSMTSWAGGSGARTISVLQSKNLAFHWDGSAAGSGYGVTVRFTNGCQVGN
jgi:serine/threonine-protein kinase